MLRDDLPTTGAPAGQRPLPDHDSGFYWQALTEHRLDLQRCSACDRARFPAMPSCPFCGARAADVTTATGAGVLYSWVTAHVPLVPAMATEVPYTIGTVELDEGCRVLARLELSRPPHQDMRLTARFVDHAGWTELRFADAPAGRP